MRAQIRLAQGRGQDALRDCMNLFGREAGWIWSGCSAQALAITGRLPQARRLLETSFRGQLPAGTGGSWVAGIMAALAQQAGDAANSESWLKRALAIDPDDHVAALELIDLWNSSGRAQESLQLLHDRPASDAFLLRKAIALRNLGRAELTGIVEELKRRFTEADQLADRTHLRERAAFELEFGDAHASLAHARENFRNQRELVDLRLLLRAAVAARDKGGASEGLSWLRESHIQDQRLMPELASLGEST